MFCAVSREREHHAQVWSYLYELTDVLAFYTNAAIRTDPLLLHVVELTAVLMTALPPGTAAAGSAAPLPPPPPPRHLRHLVDAGDVPDAAVTAASGDVACIALRTLIAQLSDLLCDETVAAVRPAVRTKLLAIAQRFFPRARRVTGRTRAGSIARSVSDLLPSVMVLACRVQELENSRLVIGCIEHAITTDRALRARHSAAGSVSYADLQRSLPALHFAPALASSFVAFVCHSLQSLCAVSLNDAVGGGLSDAQRVARRSEKEAFVRALVQLMGHSVAAVRERAYGHLIALLHAHQQRMQRSRPASTAVAADLGISRTSAALLQQHSDEKGGAAAPPFVFLFHRAILFQLIFYGTFDKQVRALCIRSVAVVSLTTRGACL
jgi:hypothetical protein